jgi:hypothetical protein
MNRRILQTLVAADVRKIRTPKRGGMRPTNWGGDGSSPFRWLRQDEMWGRAVPTPFVGRLICYCRKKSEPPHVGCYELGCAKPGFTRLPKTLRNHR